MSGTILITFTWKFNKMESKIIIRGVTHGTEITNDQE